MIFSTVLVEILYESPPQCLSLRDLLPLADLVVEPSNLVAADHPCSHVFRRGRHVIEAEAVRRSGDVSKHPDNVDRSLAAEIVGDFRSQLGQDVLFRFRAAFFCVALARAEDSGPSELSAPAGDGRRSMIRDRSGEADLILWQYCLRFAARRNCRRHRHRRRHERCLRDDMRGWCRRWRDSRRSSDGVNQLRDAG